MQIPDLITLNGKKRKEQNTFGNKIVQDTIMLQADNSLRSWRYCVGARLKIWRRSRVPKKGSRDEVVEIPPARKPRYFEWSAHQCAGKRIGRGPYICQSC